MTATVPPSVPPARSAKGGTTATAGRAPEAPLTLDLAPPRTLSLFDQVVLWGNLGISLTGPVTAAFVVAPTGVPPLSLLAALVACVVGSVVGSTVLGLAAVPGARTGAPAMVLMRGLFGRRGSYVPTVLNLLQNVGWATVEVIVIAEAATRLTSPAWRPVWVLVAGAGATLMAVRPLGSVRLLRKIIVWLVLAASAYLLVSLLREPLPAPGDGSWTGFWLAFDVVVAVCVSWAPLAADYSRHSRTGRAAFGGALLGYAAAATLYIGLGVLAFATVVGPDGDVIAALLAVPAGALALLILLVDEVDEAFANVYSTTMSLHNLAPRLDRRFVAVGVGAVAVGLALSVDIVGYESFLFLIGSVFVPLFAVVIVDFFLVRRGAWDLSDGARMRWSTVPAWLLGFVTYQLLNPGTVPGWSDAWTAVRDGLGIVPGPWTSASLLSFAVAGAATLAAGATSRP
jgi:nucleobase:cation symporter-1, NCS1 family